MGRKINFKATLFFKQAQLMLRAMSQVAKEKDFAVKGGTAINLFVRDMPRLSVDIDLTYLPIEPREVSLRNINDGLKRMASRIKENLPGTSVKKITAGGSQLSKLVVDSQGVKIKIEPNTVIRGTVYPPEQRDLSKRAEEMFELSVSANILSIADLYGGKICAALDRQHPRDLFDIKTLFENEGIKPEIRKAFVVYLACHDRPISELLAPIPKDTRLTFKNEFLGMTISPVKYRDLRMTLKTLISTLKKDLSEKERRFLVLLKEGNPDWTLLDIPGIDRLPAIQWKLRNIHKMDKKKHSDALSRLKKILRI